MIAHAHTHFISERTDTHSARRPCVRQEDFGELKRVLAGENLEAIIESTKRAIELRLLEEQEWSAKKIVARKSGVGISASSLVKDLSRRNTPTQKDLEF